MKFKILINDYDEGVSSPGNKPFDNAYSETTTKIDQHTPEGELWTWKAVLVYDDDNKPKAEMKKIIEKNKPNSWWFNYGKNHQCIDEIKNIWQFEITETNWYIDIETLQELQDFCILKSASAEFGKDYNSLSIWD